MTKTVVHIGFPKTATTTLQSVMMQHPECAYLGKGLRDTMAPSLSLDVAGAVLFADTRRFEAGLEALRARIADHAGPATCLMLSDEAFTFSEHMEIGQHWQRQCVTDHEVIADRLARLCPNADVLMSLRNQYGVLQSFFRQRIKRGASDESFESFIDRELAALPHRSMLHLLEYDAVLEAYQTRFGASRVKVCVYESYKTDFGRYLDDVAALCGVDAQAARAAWGGAHDNKAPASRERSAMRKLRGLIPDPFKKLVPKALRTQVNQAVALPPVEARFTPAQTQQLHALFAPSNAALAEKTGLDLARWDYPLP